MTDQEKEIGQLKRRVEELVYAKEQLEHRVVDLIMTRAKNAMVALTDEEREAIRTAAGCMGLWMIKEGVAEDESLRWVATTLRGLLERLP